MRFAWIAIALFAARFAVAALTYPPGDGDLLWQRWLGLTILRDGRLPHALGAETFTAAGAPWIPQEWAFSVAVALAGPGVPAVLFALTLTACAIAALALVAGRALRRGATPVAAAIVTLFVGMALLQSFGLRAQILAWPALAALLWLFDLESPWLWAAVPLVAVWANLHASAVLAPALAAVAACGVAFEDRRWSPRLQRRVVLACALVGAVCATPLGIALPGYAVALLRSPIRSAITEWHPTSAHDASFLLGALPLLAGACVWGLGARDGRWKDACIFGACAWLMFSAARNIPLFAIAAAPLIAPALGAAIGRRSPASAPAVRAERWEAVAVPLIGFAGAGAIVALLVAQRPAVDTHLPYASAAVLAHDSSEHRVLCEDFAWCSVFLEHHRAAVFLDARCDPYPQDVWEDYLAIARVRGDWRTRLDRRGVDAVIAHRDGALAFALGATPAWRIAQRDASFVLYVRGANPALAASVPLR